MYIWFNFKVHILYFIDKISQIKKTVQYRISSMKVYRVSQEERSIFWEVIVSVILSKNVYMNMCHIPNGFLDRAIWMYNRKIVDEKEILGVRTVSNVMWICVKRQLAVVTVDSYTVGVLWKMPHIFTNAAVCWYDVCLWFQRW